MLKKIGIGLLVAIIFVLMFWFTSNNPGDVEIDLAFGVDERAQFFRAKAQVHEYPLHLEFASFDPLTGMTARRRAVSFAVAELGSEGRMR